ncbi:XRE family transcriptional regulator [Amycolatopsis panacis]|uniref:XRE family transcriptional regulator n=1 Tax=Amycolatopsis panacis TaxID=2340917 RepID=A0A419I9Y2_9PSEU|nr:XRE family transcriptional regulator [Amycolatopsis panacis]
MGIGTRVASRRKLAGLTQAQLAQVTHYSLSTVRAVEQGREPASPAFTAAMARALKVDHEELTGAPFRDTIDQDGPLEGLSDLRSILSEGQYVRPLAPEPLDVLAAEMDAVNLVYRNDKGRQALARLPVLLRQMHGAVREAHSDADRARAYTLLSAGYVTVERLCRRFGFMSLCTPAVDRLEWVAGLADDPLYVAQAKVKRARVLMYLDATDESETLIESGLDDVAGDGEAPTAVRGYAHLCGAIAAARGRNPDLARDHIAEARKLAELVGGESEEYGTLFGKGNVGIHACAVEMESGDPARAARDGSALKLPVGIAPPRAGHHWQDTARAWLLAGEPAKALGALNRARKVAPQQTRLHPSVRETIIGVAEAERRRNDSLSNFATWVGLKI